MTIVTITPQLRTTDLDGSIRFYTERWGSSSSSGTRTSVREGRHLHLYLGVDDVDAFGQGLRAAGVDLLQPPCDTDWGTRELVFNDDQGHTIYAGMPRAAA